MAAIPRGGAALRRPRFGHRAGDRARAGLRLPRAVGRLRTASCGGARGGRGACRARAGVPRSTASCGSISPASAARRSRMRRSRCPSSRPPAFRSRTCRRATPSCCRSRSAWAEVLGARDLFIGVNVLDSSGYPDCRPEFIAAFAALAALATKAGVEGHPLPRARTAHRLDQGADHPRGHAARRRLRADGVLLPGRCRGARLRSLRRLPPAPRRLRGRGSPGSDPLPGAVVSSRARTHRPRHRQGRTASFPPGGVSSVGRASDF